MWQLTTHVHVHVYAHKHVYCIKLSATIACTVISCHDLYMYSYQKLGNLSRKIKTHTVIQYTFGISSKSVIYSWYRKQNFRNPTCMHGNYLIFTWSVLVSYTTVLLVYWCTFIEEGKYPIIISTFLKEKLEYNPSAKSKGSANLDHTLLSMRDVAKILFLTETQQQTQI